MNRWISSLRHLVIALALVSFALGAQAVPKAAENPDGTVSSGQGTHAKPHSKSHAKKKTSNAKQGSHAGKKSSSASKSKGGSKPTKSGHSQHGKKHRA